MSRTAGSEAHSYPPSRVNGPMTVSSGVSVSVCEDGDAHAVAPGHHSPVGFLCAGNDAQERGLFRAVRAKDADAAAVVEADRDPSRSLR